MRALITGGAGFIGSHLAEALLAEGMNVRVLDNLSTGSPRNLQDLPIEFLEGDVADYSVVETAVNECDIIFHQAALVSVPYSIKHPMLNHASNVTGTFNVFEAARQAGIKRVIYASSAAVYGNQPGLPKRESDLAAPITPYAAAKRTAELMATTYAINYGVECIALRYMNVFGPRQDPSSPYSGVLSIFCRNILADAPITIFGDGEQTRDFVYIADVVQANLLASQAPVHRLPQPPIFNIGRGEQTSLNQIVALLSEINGHSISVNYQEARQGDIKHSVADISQAREALGFNPHSSLSIGLKHTLDWFKTQLT